MEISLLALIAVLLAARLALQLIKEPLRSDDLVKKSVVVTTRDDETLRGVLIAEHMDRWTLAQAFYRSSTPEGPRETPIDGVLHIPRSNIAYVQEVEAR